MHHRPNRIRRRSSSLSAIANSDPAADCTRSGGLSDDDSALFPRSCRSHEKRSAKKRCRKIGSSGSSAAKFADPWAIRTYKHQQQHDRPRAPLSPAFTFPSNAPPSRHLEPAFEFQSSLDAFNLPSIISSSPITASTSSAASSTSTSTRLRNGSLGSSSSFFADESLGSSPSTSASSKGSGWPTSSSSSAFPNPFTSITPSTSPPLDDSMDCDESSPASSLSCSPDESNHQLDEVSRLHHAAFESLRTSTQAEEEGFLSRLRRWEAEKQLQQEQQAAQMQGGGGGLLSVSPLLGVGVRAPPTSPQGPTRRNSPAEGEAGSAEQQVAEEEAMVDIFQPADIEEEEDDEDINIVLSPSPSPVKLLGAEPALALARGRGMRPKTNLEVEELSRKLKGGVVLEDYGLVREYQERGRGRQGSRDSLLGRA